MSRTSVEDRSEELTGHRLRPVSHRAFRDPVTRMLLSSDGSTTRLLEATVGPLGLRVLHQAVGTAERCPETIRTALRLDPRAQIINRCSALVDGDARPVSLNHVVAPFVPHSRVGEIVSGTAAGIGPELARQHVEHHRELLACGLAWWPDTAGPRPAAAKVYVIWQGEERLMYIREMFNPDVIPADVISADVVPAGAAAAVPAPDAETLADRPASTASSTASAWHGSSARKPSGPPLEAMPGLVTSAESADLRATLALAAAGRGFVIQVGGADEAFDRCTREAVEGRHALIRLLATAAGYGLAMPVAAVGALPAHPGDEADGAGAEPSSAARRMSQAYLRSAAVLHALRNADQQADTRWIRWLKDELGRRRSRHPRLEAILVEVDFALRFGASGTGWPRTFVAEEALVPDYERALVRADAAGGAYGSSGHLLWLGERARDPEGEHVAFAASIANPVAVRLAPDTDPGEVLDLCRRIDPRREPGKLALVVGTRAAGEEDLPLGKTLPGLLRAVDDAGHPVVWLCDPTRAPHPDEIPADIAAFFDAHAEAGTRVGGLHLEVATQDVAGRVGDPRLHPLQALECVLQAVELARVSVPTPGKDPAGGSASP